MMKNYDTEMMKVYNKVILNMNEELADNEEYIRIYKEYNDACDLLFEKLPYELKKDFLRYDSAEENLLAFFELYFFRHVWERKKYRILIRYFFFR